MFLLGTISICLSLFTAIAAAVSENNNDPITTTPDLRLTPEEVEKFKAHQIHEPGYIHGYTTFGEGANKVSVPIVEGDYDIFLENEQGIKARSLAGRGLAGSCLSFTAPPGDCLINYCWRGTGPLELTFSQTIRISGSNGQSNPTLVESSDTRYLRLTGSDGYNGWFPRGHECSNSNTQIYTDHLLQGNVFGEAYVDRVRCENCNFRNLYCPEASSPLKNNLIAFSNGVASQSSCT